MVWGKKTREEYEKEENNLNLRMPFMQIFDGVTLMKPHVILKSVQARWWSGPERHSLWMKYPPGLIALRHIRSLNA